MRDFHERVLTDDEWIWRMSQHRQNAAAILAALNDMLDLRPHLEQSFSVDGLRLQIFKLEDRFPEKLKR